jgi:ribonuclease P protein component
MSFKPSGPQAPKPFAFARDNHVRKRSDFELIYRTGTKRSGRLMTMFTRERDQGRARLGIAATRKMGDAVRRNRAKRVVRELFRHHKPLAPIDIVVVPRRELLEAPFARIEAEFRALLERSQKRLHA